MRTWWVCVQDLQTHCSPNQEHAVTLLPNQRPCAEIPLPCLVSIQPIVQLLNLCWTLPPLQRSFHLPWQRHVSNGYLALRESHKNRIHQVQGHLTFTFPIAAAADEQLESEECPWDGIEIFVQKGSVWEHKGWISLQHMAMMDTFLSHIRFTRPCSYRQKYYLGFTIDMCLLHQRMHFRRKKNHLK